MAKSKPLMTPEQQKMFKQAVAAKAIPHMDYEDYCKITPKEAEKMLKAVEGKVDFKYLITKLKEFGYDGDILIEREIPYGEERNAQIRESKVYLEKIIDEVYK